MLLTRRGTSNAYEYLILWPQILFLPEKKVSIGLEWTSNLYEYSLASKYYFGRKITHGLQVLSQTIWHLLSGYRVNKILRISIAQDGFYNLKGFINHHYEDQNGRMHSILGKDFTRDSENRAWGGSCTDLIDAHYHSLSSTLSKTSSYLSVQPLLGRLGRSNAECYTAGVRRVTCWGMYIITRSQCLS